MLNGENFTDRAQAYAKTRPGYPEEAIEYINSLVPPDAVFADIGAGTGKFTELLARHGNKVFAVEPNADMREQLKITLAPFSNTIIVDGSAEATTLAGNSIDFIVSAQALNWFDLAAFKTECQRIGKNDYTVITLFNNKPDDVHSISRYQKSTEAFYKNPVIREFPNPIYFTRDNWLLYLSSMAGVPQKNAPGYKAYVAEMNEVFDRESTDGILRLDLVTKVYSEKGDA